MNRWLIKSEPDAFSFSDLEAVASEPWNGVRNYQARNFLRQMKLGDRCLFYHSNVTPPGIVGLARVVREHTPDNLQFDPESRYYDPRSDSQNPRWSMVDIAAVRPLPRFVSLSELRECPAWEQSPLVKKGARLSVLPVRLEEWKALEALLGEQLN